MSRKTLIATALAVASACLGASAAAAPNDPYFWRQWGLTQIEAEPAWQFSDGTGALVAVVDSGVDVGHPDLVGKVINYPDSDMHDPEGTCTTQNGEKTCVQDGSQDKNGHGTHVAGIAAATTGNGVGIAGTAPGAQILAVRVLNRAADGTTTRLAQGIRYAADKGAQVINLSLGVDLQHNVVSVPGSLRPVHQAIDYAWKKGAVIIAAAGNDYFPLCTEPARTTVAVCVGATDRNDVRSFYSNSDATTSKTYVVAPGGDSLSKLGRCGGDIISTYLRSSRVECSEERGYTEESGTSMSTAFVSGIAALLVAQGLDNSEIVECLITTSDDLGPAGRDATYGYGRVNAHRAVTECGQEEEEGF